MLVFDANFLLLLVDPDAIAPKDPATDQPVTQARQRIEHLLSELAKSDERVGIPTPALAEVLVGAQGQIAGLVAELTAGYKLKTLVFDEMAAIEVALMADNDARSQGRLSNETKAKVKYDRQIIAIAKVNGADAIYTADQGLRKKAESIGIQTTGLEDIALPPEAAQGKLNFPDQKAPGDEKNHKP